VGVCGSWKDLDALEGRVLDLLLLVLKKSRGSWLVLTLTLLLREDLLRESREDCCEWSLIFMTNKIKLTIVYLIPIKKSSKTMPQICSLTFPNTRFIFMETLVLTSYY
jgi:hypothetical protein